MPINRKLNVTYRGAPCAKGHDGLRYRNGSACVECERLRNARKKKIEPAFATELFPQPYPIRFARLVKGRDHSGSR